MDLMLIGRETGFTLILFVIGIIIVLFAQFRVNNAYNKSKRIKNSKGLSGFEVARQILDQNGLRDVHIVEVKGNLSDHYDPSKKVVRLSHDVFHGESIAAISIAAHEVGHAIQDKTGYIFMNIRSFLVPIVNLITYLGYIVAFISLFAGITGYIKVGIFMVLIALLFQIITLPVEFNASNRAKKQLQQLQIIDNNEIKDVNAMLGAAAMTYVAAFISSIINLIRLILMLRDE